MKIEINKKNSNKTYVFFSGESESSIKNRGSHLKYFLRTMRISYILFRCFKVKKLTLYNESTKSFTEIL